MRGDTAHPIPGRAIEAAHALEPEATACTGWHAGRDHRGFDDDRARSAKRVEQRLFRCPAGQGQQTGRKVLLHRRVDAVTAPAALEERFSRPVQV